MIFFGDIPGVEILNSLTESNIVSQHSIDILYFNRISVKDIYSTVFLLQALSIFHPRIIDTFRPSEYKYMKQEISLLKFTFEHSSSLGRDES